MDDNNDRAAEPEDSAEARLRKYVARIHDLDAQSAELDRIRRAVYQQAKSEGFATRAVKAAVKSAEEPAAAFLGALGAQNPKQMLRHTSFGELLFGSERFPSEWLEDQMPRPWGDALR